MLDVLDQLEAEYRRARSDPAFARDWELGWVLEQEFRVLSYRLRSRAKRLSRSGNSKP